MGLVGATGTGSLLEMGALELGMVGILFPKDNKASAVVDVEGDKGPFSLSSPL